MNVYFIFNCFISCYLRNIPYYGQSKSSAKLPVIISFVICHHHPVILSPRHIIIQQCDPLTDNIRIYRYADNKETFKPQIAGQKFPCFGVMVMLIDILQQDKDVTAFF